MHQCHDHRQNKEIFPLQTPVLLLNKLVPEREALLNACEPKQKASTLTDADNNNNNHNIDRYPSTLS